MKQKILDTIESIDENIEALKQKIKEQEKRIIELEQQNKELKQTNISTLDQIKDYIKELEQIRSHYVNSNN